MRHPLGGGSVIEPLKREICDAQAATGYYEPVRTALPPAPPPSPPPPPCEALLQQHCKLPFKSIDACLQCTRNIPDVGASCKPKQRQAYCGATTVEET